MQARDSASQQVFGELGPWQAMLERNSELFSGVQPGARIGIMPRSAPGSAEQLMLVWQVAEGGISARFELFDGIPSIKADLLLAADADAMTAIRDALSGDILAAMKRQIRRGGILVYVLRTKRQLQDAGYEDLLDSLGSGYLGACR
ncbi:MAG: hypothetical protein AB1714_22070 [Acidobacteriota bacterium]